MAENKQRKRMENDVYYFVGHLSTDGIYTPLLLTEREMKVAKDRATKNPEDLHSTCVVFQQVIDGKAVGEKFRLHDPLLREQADREDGCDSISARNPEI